MISKCFDIMTIFGSLLPNNMSVTSQTKKTAQLSISQLEGTHRVQIHSILLLLLVSQKCINKGIIAISVKNALINLVTLTFDLSIINPQNRITSRISQGHSLYQSLNTLGSFVFSYVADKQTDKQTELNILPMPTDSVGVSIIFSMRLKTKR